MAPIPRPRRVEHPVRSPHVICVFAAATLLVIPHRKSAGGGRHKRPQIRGRAQYPCVPEVALPVAFVEQQQVEVPVERYQVPLLSASRGQVALLSAAHQKRGALYAPYSAQRPELAYLVAAARTGSARGSQRAARLLSRGW